jgi:hypothetical protein
LVRSRKAKQEFLIRGLVSLKALNHNERCKECKTAVLSLLESLFGEVKKNYSLPLGSKPEFFEGNRYYPVLKGIFNHLQKSRGHQQFVRSPRLPNVDFFVPNPGFIVEFDEGQHFTEQRMISLKDYPADLELGYDRDLWIDRCRMLHRRDNDPPFRDEQRAWYDTLRDFAPAILNLRPTVRLFSKARIWCKLNHEDAKDVATFKEELFKERQ